MGTVRRTISIHALLAESDRLNAAGAFSIKHFYPRSPCGERLGLLSPTDPRQTISIHALLAESDLFNGDQGHIKGDISIHALLAESDSVKSFMRNGFFLISIHALLAESDRGLLWWTTPA